MRCHQDRGRPSELGELYKVRWTGNEECETYRLGRPDQMHEFLAVQVVKGQYRVERIKDQAAA